MKSIEFITEHFKASSKVTFKKKQEITLLTAIMNINMSNEYIVTCLVTMYFTWLLCTNSSTHKQKKATVQSLFLGDRITHYSSLHACRLVFEKKTLKFPSVTPHQTVPDGLGGPKDTRNLLSHLGSSSTIILDTEFQPVDASPRG